MKNKKIIISIVIATCMLAVYATPVAMADVPASLDLSCDSAMLMDAQTGEIVFGYNENERMPVASVNKIMTLYLVFTYIQEGRISLDDTVLVSRNAASMGGSQVYLEEGGEYRLDELLKSIIVASANDSCVALAEHASGTVEGFVIEMNNTAKALGLSDSLYENSTGLPAQNHYMSAHDIAKLSVEIMKFEEFFTYSTIWTENFQHPSGRTTLITNTNKLINYYAGCDGIKTGFTNEAMYCLSATAKKGDTRLIAVVLGEPTGSIRNNDIAEMFNYGFANYTTYVMYKKGDIVKENINIYGAKDYDCHAVADEDVCLFVDKSMQGNVTTAIDLDESLVAPLTKGDVIGQVQILVDGRYVKSYPICISRDVEKMSFWDCLAQVFDLYCNRLLETS